MLNVIYWNPGEILFQVGSLAIRYYSLCWCIGLLLGYLIMQRLYRHQNIPDEKFEPLFIYCFGGILIGARLGHCIFYEPSYFLTSGKHFIEMLLPIRFAIEGWDFHFVGYEGLASHGGTLGLMIALWLYVQRHKVPFQTVLDNIAIATPVTAGFIRLGNLMNSEIVGRITDVPWAFVFERLGPEPRHPGQLYEALAYFLLLIIGLLIYKKHKDLVGTGFYFGLCLTYIFTFRFFIEFLKENQEAFEDGMLFNMGQLLSVPFVLLGSYCIWRSLKK